MEVARDREVFSIKKLEGDMEAEWLDLCSVLDVAIGRFLEARRSEGE